MSVGFDDDTLTAGTRLPARPRPGPGRLVVVLEGERPLAAPVACPLSGRRQVTLGRGPARKATAGDGGATLELRFPDRRISTRHAHIILDRGAPLLEDLGSKNGCYVNDQRCLRRELEDGDLLRLGEVHLMYRREGDVDPSVLEQPPYPGPVPELDTFVPSLAETLATLAEVARSRIPILVTGESGTGKELVARAVHARSGRSGRLVAVNCAALPRTLLEAELFGYRRGAFSGAAAAHQGLIRAADGGTLFLDEIAELEPAGQAALLRVLQEHEVLPIGETAPTAVDLRVVAATNRRISELEARGLFRADLWARLVGFSLHLPPLRARIEDLGLLLAGLLARELGERASGLRLGEGVASALLRHRWPQNVRELAQVVSHASLLTRGDRLELDALPASLRTPPPRATDGAAPDARRAELEELLRRHGGNVSAVARVLGKDRKQVHRWMRRLGVHSGRSRD